MKIEHTRFVTSPNGSALGLPAGEYWAVPDSEMKRIQLMLSHYESICDRISEQEHEKFLTESR